MNIDTLLSISKEFRLLAARFDKYESRDAASHFVAEDIYGAMIQAGRLAIEAIDLDAFPRELARQNGGWWDRNQGRIPGGTIAVYGNIPHALITELQVGGMRFDPQNSPEATAAALATYKQDVQALSQDWQFSLCWIFTIGWLHQRFPSKLRNSGYSLFFTHAATDEHGTPVGHDRKPLKKVETENGGWKLDGEIANVEDFYNEEEWRIRHKRRAETCADACRLMADLIEDGVRTRQLTAATVEEASKAARSVGRSVLRLLWWARLAREAGRLNDSSLRTADDPGIDLRNIDIAGVVWDIVCKHASRASGFSNQDLENLALFVGSRCTEKRPDLREAFDRFQEKKSLRENENLFDVILDEIEGTCPGVAGEVMGGADTANVDCLTEVSPSTVEPKMLVASWYSKATNKALYPELLRQACCGDRIRGKKYGGRWYYDFESVCAIYPEYSVRLNAKYSETVESK